jgi:hypothetical protein
MRTALISTEFWEDNDIYEMNFDTRQLYLCILTNPKRNTTPAFKCMDRFMALYTGMNSRQISICRQQLIDAKKIVFIDDWYILMPQDLVKPSKGKLSEKIYEQYYETLPKSVKEIIDKLNLNTSKTHTSTENIAHDPLMSDSRHKDKDNNKDKYKINKDIEKATQVATRLFNWIKKNYPNREHNKQDIKKWAVDIEKINRLDKQDWDLIVQVLDWSQKNDFWHKNIKSGKKLRLQFNNLLDYREDDLRPRDIYGRKIETTVRPNETKRPEKNTKEVKRADINSEAYKKFLASKEALKEKLTRG